MPAEPAPAAITTYTVAVRTLCDFTARQGDLDTRFTPGPTAAQGQEGHRLVASRRPSHWTAEASLSGRWRHLLVRGRADGVDVQARRVEEIKTHRGPIERVPANHRALHWAQARTYGWLLCEAEGLASIELALVYYDIDSGRETVHEAWHTRDELTTAVDALCRRYADWAVRERAHRLEQRHQHCAHALGVGLAERPRRLRVDILVAGENRADPVLDADGKGELLELARQAGLEVRLERF